MLLLALTHIFYCVKTIRMLGTARSAPLQGDVDREAQTGGRRELFWCTVMELVVCPYRLAPFGSSGCHG